MKSKKLYYVPGLISLVGIPLLFLIFQVDDPITKVVLKVWLPKETKSFEAGGEFTKAFVLNSIKGKKVIRICLDNEGDEDYNSFNVYRDAARRTFVMHEMEHLQFTGDTSSVLQVEMGNENNYQDFVQLVNLAAIYKFKRYAFIDDSFFFLANPPIEAQSIEVTSEPVELAQYDWKGPDKWQLIKERIAYEWDELYFYIKYNLGVSIAFIALIIIPSIFWFRRNTSGIKHIL